MFGDPVFTGPRIKPLQTVRFDAELCSVIAQPAPRCLSVSIEIDRNNTLVDGVDKTRRIRFPTQSGIPIFHHALMLFTTHDGKSSQFVNKGVDQGCHGSNKVAQYQGRYLLPHCAQ